MEKRDAKRSRCDLDKLMKKEPASRPVILTVIVNRRMGERVLAFAAMHEAHISIINPGLGTVRKAIQREIGVSDLRKEIVTIFTGHHQAKEILVDLKEEMNLEEKHSGVAFVRSAIEYKTGSGDIMEEKILKDDKGENLRAIYVIVKKGFAEEVLLAGEQSGTQGATVVGGRGDGQASRVSGEIADEKDLILIITTAEKAMVFLKTIQQDQTLRTVGQAQVVVMGVTDSVGINFL